MLHSRIARHDDKYRRQHDDWRRAYHLAASMRERFPKIEELVVRVTFTDTQNFGTYSPLMHIFSPSAKAFFAVACPSTLCLDGGFDLDAIIANLLRSAGQVATGRLDCAGHAQRELPGEVNCLLHLRYEVHVKYASSSGRTWTPKGQQRSNREHEKAKQHKPFSQPASPPHAVAGRARGLSSKK